MKKVFSRLVFFCLAIAFSTCLAGELKSPTPGARDKCPVCGMFVGKYPDWATSVTFSDAATSHFDGAKDMFTFLLNMNKFAPNRATASVAGIRVKDYYSLQIVDGKRAFYVIGSDVFGPMGKEAIPFAKEADAREFLKDHKGKKILRFEAVTRETLKSLQ